MRRLSGWLAFATLLGLSACDAVRVEHRNDGEEQATTSTAAEHGMMAFGPAGVSPGQLNAALRGALQGHTGDAIDDAVSATMSLENAMCASLVASGCSALDNEVDAAVMGRGRFGAVAVVRGATNPIVIAQLVSDTPFVALVGDAALDLAGMLPRHGVLAHHADTRFAQYFDDDPKPRAAPPPAPPRPAAPATVDAEPRTESAEATPQRVDPQHDDGTAPPASSSTAEAEPAPSMRRLRPLGSAGAIAGFGVVARVGSDDFAAAVSTVGSLRMPRGRITAAPVEGAAIFAGAAGAVAATGEARHLIREQLARHVYERIAAGATAEEAVGWAIAGAPEGVALGVIAISNNDSYAAATRHFVSSKLALGTGGTL